MLCIPRIPDWDPSEIHNSTCTRFQHLGDLVRSFPRISKCSSSRLLGVSKYLSKDGIPDLELFFFHLGVIIPRHALLLGLHSDPRRSSIMSLSVAKSEVLFSSSKFSYQNEGIFISSGIIASLPYAMDKGVPQWPFWLGCGNSKRLKATLRPIAI